MTFSSTGCLLDQTPVRMLFDTGACKSDMSMSFYMLIHNLHKIRLLSISSKGIIVGNGQPVPVLFVLPVVVSVCGHLFEIYTIVVEIHECIDLEFGIKIW